MLERLAHFALSLVLLLFLGGFLLFLVVHLLVLGFEEVTAVTVPSLVEALAYLLFLVGFSLLVMRWTWPWPKRGHMPGRRTGSFLRRWVKREMSSSALDSRPKF